MKEKVSAKMRWRAFGFSFLLCFLLTFMLLIFGPAELYFTNVSEFKFVYGEFAWRMALIAVGATCLMSLILAFLPDKVRRVILAMIFGVSLAGYLQIMFINKDLDLMGMNPDGYHVEIGRAAINMVVWVLIAGALIVLCLWKEKIWKNTVLFATVVLLGMQATAWVSLMLSADDTAYHYEEGAWYISGENQYTVSADKNIIVFVLDYFSNQYLSSALNQYPDMLDCMKDFTYYSNTDCAYFGTYPSLAHILSGSKPEPQISINDWCAKIWQDDKAQGFYQALRDQNYVVDVYTPDKDVLCGTNGVEVLKGTFSNLANDGQDFDVDYKLLVKTMTKMSGYRMFPYAVKPALYANVDEYTNIIIPRNNRAYHENYAFYAGLKERGLTADKNSNYYIVQHLQGTHAQTTTATCEHGDTTTEETAKGCMVMIEEYLNQLKELGVYDNATIIVTSDHGGPRDSQVIFFIKYAWESHKQMLVSDAPISLTEYQATIAQVAGIDYSPYGLAVSDIPQGQPRERTVWVRMYDESLPSVPKYSGEGEAVSNAYFGFTYTGDINDLLESYDAGPDIVIPETDGFF